MNAGSSPQAEEDGSARPVRWTACALVMALAGAAGSLWLSIGMGLKPCPLCYYQRTFMMAVLGILLMGLLTPARRSALPSLLALPAAAGGLGVAVFHVGLEATGKLECPPGLLELGTAPVQSLAVFLLLMVPLAGAVFQSGRAAGSRGTAALAGVFVGALFAFGAIRSAPSLPAPPAEPYEEPLIVCRPPFEP